MKKQISSIVINWLGLQVSASGNPALAVVVVLALLGFAGRYLRIW